jgi:hypothetical protein
MCWLLMLCWSSDIFHSGRNFGQGSNLEFEQTGEGKSPETTHFLGKT